MNKDFQLKKIEVGTPIYKTSEPDSDGDTNTSFDYTKRLTSLDTDAYGDGVYSWKKISNGKKLKLNKTDYESQVGYHFKNRNVTKKSKTTTTYIRITYYDKKNKTTHRTYQTIRLVQK